MIDDAEKSMEQSITLSEFCAIHRVSPRVARRAIETGALPGYRIGRSFRLRPEAVEEWLRRGGSLAPQEPTP